MKAPIVYGFSIASIMAVAIIVFDLICIENGFSSFLPFIILAVGLFIAMRKARIILYNNELNYGQAMYSGVVITAFAVLFFTCYNFVYFQFVNPVDIDEVIRVSTKLMVDKKLSIEEIQKEIENIKATHMPINLITGTFVLYMLVGVVFSAVYSSILRTKDTFTQVTKPRE